MSPGEASYIIQTCLDAWTGFVESTGYDNPELNGLLAQAFTETEQNKLKEVYGKMPGFWRMICLRVSGMCTPPISGATASRTSR